jgi:(p)ppGpp synthase/HD superfamily hydrolase
MKRLWWWSKPKVKLEHLDALLHAINQKADVIMVNQAELAQQLRDLKAQNEKARAEILAKIAALEAAIAAGTSTPEVDAALADLKASIQADDDLNPDSPV